MVGSSPRAQATERFCKPPVVRRKKELEWKPTAAAKVEGETSSSCSLSTDSANLPSGNLDHFLQSTTPVVPALQFPKTVRRYRNRKVTEPQHSYFSLGDLWESFKEWSAYGTGVPLIINECDSVVQYYVPYLSAIQLFANPSTPSLVVRFPGDDNEAEPHWDSYNGTGDASFIDSDSSIGREASSSAHGEATSSSIHPTFEYMEIDPPFGREPLASKISSLTSKFPDLKTYRSCDLLPPSWMSVAWYPIYRIPVGQTLGALDTCFLTFHLLWTPVKGIGDGFPDKMGPSIIGSGRNSGDKFSIPIFGLASYKFRSCVWASNGVDERQTQQVRSLHMAAFDWLRLHQVNHPDFLFFCGSNKLIK